MKKTGIKLISNNKKAYHDYFISEPLECGIELKGTEIKSLRVHSCSLKDSYIIIKNLEAYILNMHIAPYEHGNIFNHDPLRTKKLLLHKIEIIKLEREITQKGFTLVPTKVYFKDGRCKVEIALAKGKKLYDKREDLKQKDIDRDCERNFKRLV